MLMFLSGLFTGLIVAAAIVMLFAVWLAVRINRVLDPGSNHS